MGGGNTDCINIFNNTDPDSNSQCNCDRTGVCMATELRMCECARVCVCVCVYYMRLIHNYV